MKFATDLGIKAVIYDNNFINIGDQEKTAISDLFNEKEIDTIIKADDGKQWQQIKREPIYCLKPHVDKTLKRVRCFNPTLNKFSENPGKYILTVYQRADDVEEAQTVKDPKFKNKEVPYVKMIPAHPDEDIFILPVSSKKYAVLLKLPYQDNPYLFKMSPVTLDFFHNKQ